MSRRLAADIKHSDISPLLVRVIDAARYAEAHGTEEDRSGHANALRLLARLATLVVPARGVLAPVEDDLYKFIDGVTATYLSDGDHRKEFNRLLTTIEPSETRHAIEVVFTQAISDSDTAYFYAGLAFGITFAELTGRRP
jgi:hypothetical protein